MPELKLPARRDFFSSAALAAFSIGLAGNSERLVAQSASSSGSRRAKKIKIGQIGTGHAHASKLSVYRSSSDYEVVGVVEPDAELRRRAESQPLYQGLKWMSQSALLDTPGLDAVLVETRVRDLLATAHIGK